MKKKLVVSVGEDTEIKVTVLDDNGHALAEAYGGYCGGRTADEPSDWPNIELLECKAHEAAQNHGSVSRCISGCRFCGG